MQKNKKILDLNSELHKYKHDYFGDIKFSMVDSFMVVHNIAYLYLIEWARTEYFFDLGFPRDNSLFSEKMPLLTVHTEINYYSPLRFTDKYTIKTRTSFIKNSSLGFENITLDEKNNIVNNCSSILVYSNKETGKSEIIPDKVKELILNFEKEDILIL